MNSLYRAVTHSYKRTPLFHPVSSFSLPYSTRKPKPPPAEELEVPEDILSRPRPTEIPFQPKVANFINFIGVVQSPIQFTSSLDGKDWAATTISQDHPSMSSLSIPIVFEGDLAHTAACHLKKNDNIYIAGRLSAEKLPLNLTQDNFQVMVHSLNFVQGSPYAKSQYTSHKQDMKPYTSVAVSQKQSFDTSSWEDLVSKPKEWRDFRKDKLNNVVKPKHPDFKHGDGRALWLNSAPSWIGEKLEGLEFNTQVKTAKKPMEHRDHHGSGVAFWMDLIENPSKWWDKRSDKTTSRHPDFRHKDTGEGLWLDRAPEWALHKLPPPKVNPS